MQKFSSQDRARLIKLASRLPSGSPEKRAILSSLCEKTAEAVAPDPHSYNAFLSEYRRGQTKPIVDASEADEKALEALDGAVEVINLLERLRSMIKHSGGLSRVDPQRFAAKLSAGASKIFYSMGRITPS